MSRTLPNRAATAISVDPSATLATGCMLRLSTTST